MLGLGKSRLLEPVAESPFPQRGLAEGSGAPSSIGQVELMRDKGGGIRTFLKTTPIVTQLPVEAASQNNGATSDDFSNPSLDQLMVSVGKLSFEDRCKLFLREQRALQNIVADTPKSVKAYKLVVKQKRVPIGQQSLCHKATLQAKNILYIGGVAFPRAAVLFPLSAVALLSFNTFACAYFCYACFKVDDKPQRGSGAVNMSWRSGLLFRGMKALKKNLPLSTKLGVPLYTVDHDVKKLFRDLDRLDSKTGDSILDKYVDSEDTDELSNAFKELLQFRVIFDKDLRSNKSLAAHLCEDDSKKQKLIKKMKENLNQKDQEFILLKLGIEIKAGQVHKHWFNRYGEKVEINYIKMCNELGFPQLADKFNSAAKTAAAGVELVDRSVAETAEAGVELVDRSA